MPSYLDILAPGRVPDDGRAGRPDLTACVRHDLALLLNTRRPPDPLTAGHPGLAASGFTYGLRDFAGADLLTGDDWDRMAEHIAAVIAAFEPRLTAVRVTARDSPAAGVVTSNDAVRTPVIHFDITARLVGPDGSTAGAGFASVFEWTTGHHAVTAS